MPTRDSAGANTLVGAVRQRLAETVDIVIAVGGLKDSRGRQAATTLDGVRDDVRAALLGWPPTPEREPFEIAAGGLIALRDGVVWWADTYRTARDVAAG